MGVFQSRTIVPLKMWLLQGNEAAVGAFFFFFLKSNWRQDSWTQKRRERCWRTQKMSWPLLGPHGPRQRCWACRFCCLRALREVVPEQQQLGPLCSEWEDRKSQTAEWASCRGRPGPLSFHSRGPRGRNGGRVLI